MATSFLLSLAVLVGDLTPSKFFVVDFHPMGGLPVSRAQYDVLINAKSTGHKPLKAVITFRGDVSMKTVRDDAFEKLQRATSYKVAKVGDTKLLFYDCSELEVKLQGWHPSKREVPAITQPTFKVYRSEKDAFQGK